jgi:deazaflavin-dependent oxidoreductase (nitroreductase family)
MIGGSTEMNKNTSEGNLIPDPPKGIRKIPWRLPIWIFRLKLDILLGHRMLLLTHKGRQSKKPRYTVLEVIKFDQEHNIHYVASGFGKKSDWYKNILKYPEVEIRCAGKSYPATAAILPVDEAQVIFQDYISKHPLAIKNLAKLIGYQIGDTEEDTLDFLKLIPVIAFKP